jgi:poly(A) polymerase
MELNAHALHICHTLRAEGYKAYFAGGWVRDWLLGHPSSDVDIATDAPLPKVLDLFPKTNLVGLAFGVVIVRIDEAQFEVAAFRKDVSYSNGRKPDAIEPSSPEEDAKRRDFTINGLFYDPIEAKLYDFVGGEEDLKKGIIRAIGNPFERFQEDRLRMIRAVRFSARFGFPIDPLTEEAIRESAPTLFPAVARERIHQELIKMSEGPNFERALIDLTRFGLLEEIFPSLKGVHLNEVKKVAHRLPINIPLVAKLRELLAHLPAKTQLEELLSLKISSKEKALIEFLQKEENNCALSKIRPPSDWARFYANPFSEIAIAIWGDEEGHQKRKQDLKHHLDRLHTKKPVVSSQDLLERGIQPGVKMGELLKAAETLAIDHDLHEAAEVIKLMGLYDKTNHI